MSKSLLVERISESLSGEETPEAIAALGTVICMIVLGVAGGDKDGALDLLGEVYGGMAAMVHRSATRVHDDGRRQ